MPLYKPETHDLDSIFSEYQKTDLRPLQRTTGGMPKRQMPRKALAGAEVLEPREVMSGTAFDPNVAIDAQEQQVYLAAHTLLNEPTEAALRQEILNRERSLALLRAELAETRNHPATGIDAARWSNANAPSGSLGMITFPGSSNKYAMDLSPDGQRIVTSSQTSQPIILDAKTGEALFTLEGHEPNKPVISAQFSPDGSLIATNSYDKKARIYHAETGALLVTIPLDSLGMKMHFLSDDVLVVGVHESDTLLCTFDVQAGTHTIQQKIAGMLASTVSLSEDRKTMSYANGQNIVIRDTTTNSETRYDAQIGEIYALSVVPGNGRIVAGGTDGVLSVFDPVTKTFLGKTAEVNGAGVAIHSIKAMPDGRVYFGGETNALKLIDTNNIPANGQIPILKSISVPGQVRNIDASANGTIIASAQNDAPIVSRLVLVEDREGAVSRQRPEETIQMDIDIALQDLVASEGKKTNRNAKEMALEEAISIDLQDEANAVSNVESRRETETQRRVQLSQLVTLQDQSIARAEQQESSLGLQRVTAEKFVQGATKNLHDMTLAFDAATKQVAKLQSQKSQYESMKTTLDTSKIELATMIGALSEKRAELRANPNDRSLALQISTLEKSIPIKTKDHNKLTAILSPQIAALLPTINRMATDLPRALSLQKNIKLQLPTATRILETHLRTRQSIDNAINASTVVRQTAEHMRAGFLAQLAVLDQVFVELGIELQEARIVLQREAEEIDAIQQLADTEHARGIPPLDRTQYSALSEADKRAAYQHLFDELSTGTLQGPEKETKERDLAFIASLLGLPSVPALSSEHYLLNEQDISDLGAMSSWTHEVTVPLSQIQFGALGSGPLTEAARGTLPSLGELIVYRGGFTPIVVNATGGIETGDNGGHMTIVFADNPYVRSFTLRMISDSPNCLYSIGDGYQPLTGSGTITVERALSQISIIVAGNAKYEITSIESASVETQVRPDFGVMHGQQLLEAAENLSVFGGDFATFRDAVRATLIDLNAADQSVFTPEKQATFDRVHASLTRILPALEQQMIPWQILTQNQGRTDEIDTLSSEWSMENGTNRLAQLSERGAVLQGAASSLIALSNALTDALSGADTSLVPALETLQSHIQSSALRLAAAIDGWNNVRDTVLIPGAETFSSAQNSLQRSAHTELFSLIHTDIDVASSTLHSADESRIVRSITVPDLGGTILIQGLHGSSHGTLALDIGTAENTSRITGIGKAMAIDLTQLSSSIHSVQGTVTSSEPTDQLIISFLRGGKIIGTQTVFSGTNVHFENAEGITGVLIENATDHMSADAKSFYEYRRMYTSPYLYSWQDPGAEHEFFSRVRTDLAPRRSEIVAEANRGDLSHPLTLSNLSLTGNVSSLTETGPALSSQSAGLYAKMNLPRLDTIAPIDHWQQFSVPYDKNTYNEYHLLKYRDNPTLRGVFYRSPNGNMQQLPQEFFELRGEMVIVYPTGQDLQIFLDVEGGYRGTSNRNFDVVQRTGETLFEALPPEGKHLSIGGTTTYNVNDGGEGWSANTSTGETFKIPNTAGSVKIGAYFANDGTVPLNITVHVYAGHEGSSGWDTPLLTYTASLRPGEVRKLVTSPLSGSGGFLRLVAFDESGVELSEAGRAISAPTMNAEDQQKRVNEIQEAQKEALAQGQRDAAIYLAQNNLPIPSTGSGSTDQISQVVVTHDPAAAERVLRTAFKALASAKESGDPVRIALEESRFTVATSSYQVALGTLDTAEKIENTRSVVTILEEERVQEVALSETQGGRLHSASTVLDMQVDSLVRVASAGMIDALSGQGATISVQNRLSGNLNRSSYENLGSFKEKTIKDKNYRMQPGETYKYIFTLQEDAMVNLWVAGIADRDIDLLLEDTISNPADPGEHQSNKKIGAILNRSVGESISVHLKKGTYVYTIRDNTAYLPHLPFIDIPSFDIKVNIEAKHFNSAKIEGKVSIEKSGKVMPVSMSVAEFVRNSSGQYERNTDYTSDAQYGGVNKLNTNKPIWVVAHGMNSREDEVKMNELTKALSFYGKENVFQIVTINWRDAAAVPLSQLGKDAVWTPAIGTWVAQQLMSVGFTPEQINLVGHSHGTYVGYAMANELMEQNKGAQMNTLVALDAAGNVELWTGFDASHINFAKVTTRSTAFEIAAIADSNVIAGTADLTFKLDSPNTFDADIVTEHSIGLSNFISVLQSELHNPSAFSPYLSFDQLTTFIPERINEQYQTNRYGSEGEVLISTDVQWVKVDDQDYPLALPSRLTFFEPNETTETIIPSNYFAP